MEVVDKIDKFVDSKETVYTYKTVGDGVYRTKEPLTKRSFKNLPKYSNGKSKVRFQDWLHIKTEKDGSYGKSEADGKWYGWSHRAVYGFGVGDEVKGDSLGKKVEYPKLPDGEFDFDNGKYEPDFVIKNDKQAREVAITFAKNVS
jgi:hypothetical protein